MAHIGAQIGNNTRNMIEKLARHPTLKGLLNPSGGNDSDGIANLSGPMSTADASAVWIPELSSMANVVVGQCARVLMVTPQDLKANFDSDSSLFSNKDASSYARNLLEYCCFRAIAVASQSPEHLKDKNFRRWTFDMFLAWESPSAESFSTSDVESNACEEAYVRLAPAVPLAADSITVYNQFEILTSNSGRRLSFEVYNKFLIELDKAIKTIKGHSSSSLGSTLGIFKGQETIIETDGTATQPVLHHVGVTAWPGRLTLTDYALYFEPSGVVSYDAAKRFDLSVDLKHQIKADLTGPMGARLFDKAIMYRSSASPEPILLEFPELIGNMRRDYWLAIIREIICLHTFMRRAKLEPTPMAQALAKTVLGIARLKAVWSFQKALPFSPDRLLTFTTIDQMPGGDLVFKQLAKNLTDDAVPVQSSIHSQHLQTDKDLNLSSNLNSESQSMITGMKNGFDSPKSKLSSSPSSSSASPSAPSPSIFGKSSSFSLRNVQTGSIDSGLTVGKLVVGELSDLEKAVIKSRDKFAKVAHAQSTVEEVKVDGIDTNLALLKELCVPLTMLWSTILSLAEWKEPVKTFAFILFVSYITFKDWLCYVMPTILFVNATLILYLRYAYQGDKKTSTKRNELVVVTPPNKNAVEQLVLLQQALQNVEIAIKNANISLLKARALVLSELPQTTDELLAVNLAGALLLTVVPFKFLFLFVFLDTFTRQMDYRKEGTRRLIRRIKEWWFRIPVVPVKFVPREK